MVEWGLVVKADPDAGAINEYVPQLDRVLPQLQPYIDSLWMTDHFFWGHKPTHEAWTVNSYLAVHFPAYRIAPIVLGQSYRNPALLAKMAATLHSLSGGRLIMGIGAGWKEDEYRAYGYDFPRPCVRIEQLEDTLEIMKRLWTETGQVTYHGKHYDTFAERVAVVRQTCESIRRDPISMRMTWFGRVVVGRTEAEALARGGEWTKQNSLNGTPAQWVEEMNRFVALGCDMFMIEIIDIENPDVIDTMMHEVFPLVGG